MSTISASTTSTTAYKVTADTTGALVFQTGATPTTAMTLGADQSVTFAGTPTYTGGTANGVAYLNGSKVLTTGSALVFDGTSFGVGIASPTFAAGTGAQINNAASADTRLRLTNAGTGTGNFDGFDLTVTSAGQVNLTGWENQPMTFLTNATERMRLDASGRLLVGRTSSDANGYFLQLNGTSGSQAGMLMTYAGVGSSAIWENSSGALVFGNDGASGQTERARIDSSGNLMVGITSSSRKLSVEGSNAGTAFLHNLRNTSGDNALIMQLGGANTNNTSSNYIFCDTDSVGVRMVVYGNGNIQNVNNSYGAYSDIKIKENITDATPKLADLMQVQIRNYNLIGEQTRQIGVIAQELEQVFPSMIEESPDRDREGNDLGTTTKSVKYSVFVPMLIKAMQEQQAIITQLQADVAALKGQA